MADKPEKLTSEQISELFKDEYFTYRFNKVFRDTVMKVILTMVLASGSVGLLVFNQLSTRYEALETEQKNLKKKQENQKEEIEKQVKVAKDLSDEAQKKYLEIKTSADGATQLQALMSKQAELSSALVKTNLSSAETSINTLTEKMTHSMEERASRLSQLSQEVSGKATQLGTLSATLHNNVKELNLAKENIEKSETNVKAAEAKINEAAKKAARFDETTNNLSLFKTFEIVTLRSRSDVTLEMKDVRPEGEPVPYDLVFSTEGLRNIRILVRARNRRTGQQWSMLYDDVRVPRNVRPSYCLQGTPWMFQGDNYMQSPFVRDFVTLKIIGKIDGCLAPTIKSGDIPPDPRVKPSGVEGSH